ncbi:MAG: hypothetical protein ACI3V3_00430, partial [Faecousia sp.]
FPKKSSPNFNFFKNRQPGAFPSLTAPSVGRGHAPAGQLQISRQYRETRKRAVHGENALLTRLHCK